MINEVETKIEIEMTSSAFDQIYLIQENDYTLEGLHFRLKIEGKGCHGFDYALGFSEKKEDDLLHTLHSEGRSLEIIIDPFSAYYCAQGLINYVFDIKELMEGFHFENANQLQFRGKFFKDCSKLPFSKSSNLE